MIALDLSKQRTLDADPKWDLMKSRVSTKYNNVVKETCLDFIQGTVKVLGVLKGSSYPTNKIKN